jgi:type IV secretory pathway TraG/TraD family ATPase VirD4
MTSSRPGSSSDTSLFLLAGAVATGAALWAAGALSALVAGHQVPRGHPLAGLEALAHVSDPSRAWGAPVGPTGLYWTVVGAVVLVIAGVAVLVWRVVRRANRTGEEDPARIEGLATRRQVETVAGAKLLVRRAGTLRPSLDRPEVSELGYFLGTSQKTECWASVEDSIFVLGPPRAGKGLHAVIPSILDSPGSVITTATRADNLTVTMRGRSARGPVGVFDPQGLASGIPAALRWSPVLGCERPQTAMVRAAALCADAGRDVELGSFWRQQTLTALRCLLHAAALGERAPADLYRWSLAAPAAREAVDILVHATKAAPAWDRALDSILSSDQRQRDSVWAMVANALACLADPQVLGSVSPEPGEEFRPAQFLKANGTLYLLGTASGAASTAGLVAALVEDVVEVARRLAAASPGGRLDPPLGLILDEAANYPLPSLPALMSEGGGTGITTMAVLQSLDQARHRWGRDAAGAIWDSAIAKIILPGVSNPDDLAGIARLVGDRKEREISETSQPGGAKSVSSSMRDRQILNPAMIRAIAPGHALLLLHSAKPIMLTLKPWTARPDAKTLRSHREAVERVIQQAAAEGLGQ